MAVFLMIATVSAGTVEHKYTGPNICKNPGTDTFIDFENGVDLAPVTTQYPGVVFSTEGEPNTWIYGDVTDDDYWNYPLFYCNGHFWTTIPYMKESDSGRIDFPNGASYVSVLISGYTDVVMNAYDASGTLVDTAGPIKNNLNTSTMDRLTVEHPGISYVKIHDDGYVWVMDDLCIGVTALPEAGFTADIKSGSAPLTVNFTDSSTNSPTQWQWDFGDGGTSILQNPTHEYISPGTYTVKLTVTNAAGSNSEVKNDYITVKEAVSDAFTITAECPVDISVTDPDGLSINKLVNEIPGATYTELGMGSDGTPDAKIEIPDRKTGDYIITVTPKPGASPTATFTLLLSSDGMPDTKIADNVPVNQIPDKPYGIRVTPGGSLVVINPDVTPVPEFPSTLMPVIGALAFIGTVLFIRRTREH
ncbi:MAG TPA: PKD domain-containing protein [Methanoregula sp.]|nr:PKD domain-containing protein [Methanoregula sp.]